MEFTLHTFLFVFFPIILTGYLLINYLANPKIKNRYLLIVSLLLYAWVSMQFFYWFLAVILLTYILGNVVNGAKADTRENKKWIAIAVSIFVFFLGYYKYYTLPSPQCFPSPAKDGKLAEPDSCPSSPQPGLPPAAFWEYSHRNRRP